eukprot:scaffold10391_cov94-Isochrysis_galbana.AAC.1
MRPPTPPARRSRALSYSCVPLPTPNACNLSACGRSIPGTTWPSGTSLSSGSAPKLSGWKSSGKSSTSETLRSRRSGELASL